MSFNSIEYAVYLPIVFLIYWHVPQNKKCVALLVSSYVFYMCWNPGYILLILIITIISFVAAMLIERNKEDKKKLILVISIGCCLSILFYFKYANFVFENVINVLRLVHYSPSIESVPLNVILPVGISFYTFQAMSYIIDVYRGDICAERNFCVYATYVSYFPQLVAGPIERTKNLLPQIKTEKVFNYEKAICGTRMILLGLFKKMAVADVLGVYVDRAYSDLYHCSGLDLLVVVFYFTIQIYCDFSGYSDIAIGTSKLLGIDLMSNFQSPYFSMSMKEFWSRWHISLSTWFKDYLYIPLGGNRAGKIRSYINLLITFLISGFWHGANWTFVVWGGVHGVAQILEKHFMRSVSKCRNLIKVRRVLCVFVFSNLAWVFFRAETVGDAFFVIRSLFRIKNIDYYMYTNIGLSASGILYSLVVIFIVVIVDFISVTKMDFIIWLDRINPIIRLISEYVMVAIIIYALVNNTSANQFVYFQF